MIFIILLVSAVALPTVISAVSNRQASEAGRILQGALVGARDRAIHDGAPAGIRLLPDPAFPVVWTAAGKVDPTLPLVFDRMVPIGPAPEYSEGKVSIFPTTGSGLNVANYSTLTGGMPCLVLEESATDSQGLANPPTSWFWNIRVGDRIQINNSGAWYTVVGPMVTLPSAGNTELFVNAGAPGTPSPWTRTINGTSFPVEFLFLVNGRDDNGNGWIDDGWDGVDNNGDPNNTVDEFNLTIGKVTYSEWESESWLGSVSSTVGISSVPYTIQRRPAPIAGLPPVALPGGMVIDATTWANAAPERSRLPVNGFNGSVEIMLNPDGTVFYSLPYGVPSSVGMDQAFYHFWLADRQDVAVPSTGATAPPYLPLAPGVAVAANITAPGTLKGHYSLLSILTRTGRTSVNQEPPFLYDAAVGYNNQGGSYNASNPFIPAEQGVNSGP